MLPVVWLPEARKDVVRIVSYIAEYNVEAAQRIREALDASTIYATHFPYMYRVSRRMPGVREISVHPYRVLYRVTSSRIEVVAVVHVRQGFPNTETD